MTTNNHTQLPIDQLQELETCLSVAGVGFLIVDSHGCVTRSNAFMNSVLGQNEAELVGFANSNLSGEMILRREGGESFVARVVVHPEADSSNGNRIVVVSDLSSATTEANERKWAAQLQKSQEEFGRFVYIVSHDLQEPLRAVVNYIGLVEKQLASVLDERTRKFMSFVSGGASRLQSMIQDLRRYSQAGRSTTTPEADLNAAIGSALAAVNRKIVESSAVVHVQENLPTVLVPDADLRILFVEILDNAIKFRDTDRPLQVEITAEVLDRNWVRIDVADNGIGVPGEHAERIFDVFRSLHRQGDFPGNGMGLPICRRIVERRGGSVVCRRGEGDRGSVMTITLPQL